MKKSTRAISLIITVCMLIGMLPQFTIAFAASNFEGTFEGQAADIFTALGFDTSVMPEGYNAETTTNPYGRETVLGNQVFEAVSIIKRYGTSTYGKDNNDVDASSVFNDIAFNRRASDMKMIAVAAGDLDGDGLPGEVVQVGYDSVPNSSDAGVNANLQLQLYDAKNEVLGTKKTIGKVNAGRAAPAGGNKLAYYDHAWQNMLQVTAGDYDNDGTMEIAVYVGENANARVDIYKFQRTSLTDEDDWLDIANWDRVWTHVLSHEYNNTPNMVSLASGDFNRDGIDDLGISGGLFAPNGSSYIITDTTALILWGATSNMLQASDPIDLADKQLGEKLTRVSLTTGDLDGDGYKELIATGQPSSDIEGYYSTSSDNNSKRAVITYLYNGTDGLAITYSGIIDTVSGKYVKLEDVTAWQSSNGFDDVYRSLPVMRTNAAAFKPQGAEYTYLYLDSCLYAFVEGTLTLVMSLDDAGNIDGKGNGLGGDGRWSAQDVVDNVVYDDDFYSEFGAVAADINGDGYDILITSIYGEESGYQHHISNAFSLYGTENGGLATQNTGTMVNYSRGESGDGTVVYERYSIGDPELSFIASAMVDIDLDTTIIKYTGNHYLKYSDPKIHAVIAAAPYFDDVERVSGYDYAWQNTTSYSKMQGDGNEKYVAVDLEAGFWLQQEFTSGGGKAVFEESAMVTLEWQEGDAYTTQNTLTFETSGNEDAVAFFSTPIECYEYDIYTPNANGQYDVETTVISRAFESVYQTISLDYYESIRKDFSTLPAIAGEVLKSTPGNPASYPSSKSGYDIIKEWDREPAGVSFGTGAVSQEIAYEHEHFEEYNVGATVDFKIGGGGELEEILTQTDLDVTGGFQFSLNPSKGWAEIDLDGTTYSGTVANMPEEFRDYGYYFNWELFVFKHKFNKDESFPVISYIVNDVSAPPELPDDFQQDYDRSESDKNVITWTYDGAFDSFHIYKYYDFPVGGGHQKVATITSDTASYILKYGDDGKPYKEYYYEDENLAAYTEYKYAVQVERLSEIPPLSTPSENITARTKAAVGNPSMTVVESDGKNDGTLHMYPDKNYYLTAAVMGPDGESADSYYTTVQYLWQKKENGAWVDMPNETDKTLTLINANSTSAGEYRCRVNSLTKADATAITSYTGSVVLTHAKRSAYFEEFYVRDVSGGGIELYAKVKNAHNDSATIPYGPINFTLTHNATGQTYSIRCELNKAGVAGIVLDDKLPKGLYTAYAYCDSSYTFKSCETETLYLSQSGEGYDIDVANEITYGDGFDITFRYITKTAGVTSASNTDAVAYTLLRGDELVYNKLGNAASVKVGGSVTRGKNYVIKVDGFDHYFTASHSGTVSIDGRYAIYNATEDITSKYIDYTNAKGIYELAQNTPAGGYVMKMSGNDLVNVYSAFTIVPKKIALQLPTMKGEEGSSASGESSDAPNILLGELALISGSYAECDMNGDVLAEALANMTVDVSYIDTAGKAFTRTNVDAQCGFYTVTANQSTIDKLSNYDITFHAGAMYILGATRKITLGARPFEDQQVGTLYAISPEYGYTRADANDADAYAQDHATGTRLVFTAVPDTGYEIYDWYVNGVAQGTQRSNLTHVVLAEDAVIEVQFAIKQNTLIFGTEGDEGGGSIVCSDPDLVSESSVLANSYFTFTAKANPGYHFKEWRYTEQEKGTIYDDTDNGAAQSSFELLMPGVSCSVYAVFERDFYTLTYTDRSGANGLTAWYYGNESGDATAQIQKVYVSSGQAVKGDMPITIEPKAGYALDSKYAFVAEGTQGTADYDSESYTVSLKEDTHVSANTVRQSYDVTFELDIDSHFAAPEGTTLTYSAGNDTRTLVYDSENPVLSATLLDVPGGTPIYAELKFPSYYIFDGFTNVATKTQATQSADRSAAEVMYGNAVKKGFSYYYETKVGDDWQTFYFIAPCDGDATWTEDAVTVYSTQIFYEISALDQDETITAHITEKQTYQVTMPDISGKGTYSFERPDGSAEQKTADGGTVFTVHKGDNLSVLVTPEPKWTVSYWRVSNEEINTYTRATSLKYTIPAIDQNFEFIPVFSPTTYNIISWTEIDRDKNGLTLSPLSGYISSIASGNDFKFTLSGPSLHLVSQVLVNGQPFVEEGSAESNLTYTGEGASRVYTISNIHENMVITTTMNELGVYVDGEDIGLMSGSGWRFDSVSNKLIITRSGAVISGKTLPNVPNLTIELDEEVISVVFEDLTLDPASGSSSNRTAVTALAEMVTITMTGDNFIEGTLKGTGLVIRGNGVMELENKSSAVINAQALTISSTGRLILDVIDGNVAMSIAGTLNFGAERDTANVPILKSNGRINANTVNVYNGDIAIDSPDYAIMATTLHNYYGDMDLTADNYVVYITEGGTGWRSYARGGHTLVYSKEIGGELTQDIHNKYGGSAYMQICEFRVTGANGNKYLRYKTIGTGEAAKIQVVYNGVTYSTKAVGFDTTADQYYYFTEGDTTLYKTEFTGEKTVTSADRSKMQKWHIVAVYKNSEVFDLSTYVFEWGDPRYTSGGTTWYPYEIVEQDNGNKYEYIFSGYFVDNSIDGRHDNVKKLTLENVNIIDGAVKIRPFSRYSNSSDLITNELFLYGDNYIVNYSGQAIEADTSQVGSALGLRSDGTGTLTLESRSGTFGTMDGSRLQIAGVKSLTAIGGANNIDAFNFYSAIDFIDYPGGITLTNAQYYENYSYIDYGKGWLQETGTTSATAKVLDNYNGTPERYSKIYCINTDAVLTQNDNVVKSLTHDREDNKAQYLYNITFPMVSGVSHVPEGASIIRADGTETELTFMRTTDPSHTFSEDVLSMLWSFEYLGLNFNGPVLKTLPDGRYTLRLKFHDEDPSDATFYYYDLPVTIVHSSESDGNISLTPVEIKAARGTTVDFNAEYMADVPGSYKWYVNGTEVENEGNTFTYTVPSDAEIDSEIKVRVESYAGQTLLGYATATVTVIPSASTLTITSEDATQNEDGSFTVAHAASDGGKWQFNASVLLNDGSTDDSNAVKWSLWGNLLRSTSVDSETGILTVDPEETGIADQLHLTAAYTAEDGTVTKQTVVIYLITDAYVSYDGEQYDGGSIISATVDGTAIDSLGERVKAGKTVVVTAAPAEDNEVTKWLVNGQDVTNNKDYTINATENTLTFTVNKLLSYDISVEFGEQTEAQITFAAGDLGTVSAAVDGESIESGGWVEKGTAVTFTALPQEYCKLTAWYVNGELVEGNTNTTLVLENITEHTEVTAEFEYAERTVSVAIVTEDGEITAAVDGDELYAETTVTENVTGITLDGAPLNIEALTFDRYYIGAESELTLTAIAPEGGKLNAWAVGTDNSFETASNGLTFTVEPGYDDITLIVFFDGPVHTHKYTTETVEPTCETMGYTVNTCECGYSYKLDYTDAYGHGLEPVETVAPTCEALGYTVYECACGYSEKLDYVSKLEHALEATETVEPTCTASGYTKYECVCGHTETKDYVDALGHELEATETVKATCDNIGYTVYECACGYSEKGDYTDSPKHSTKATETVAPTCEAMGYTVYTCECGHTEKGDYTDKTAHDIIKTLIDPDCTTPGSTLEECSNCDYSSVTAISDPKGHIKSVIGKEDATYIKDGYTGDTVCTECEEILDDGEIIPKLIAANAGYADIPNKKWYSDAVNYMTENGLMVGTSDTEFSPNYSSTRAMVVTVLYRMAGSPDVAGLANPFTDVKEGAWYYNAVIWAANNGIVSGITVTEFAPDLIATREQFVTILYRYSGSPEADTDILEQFPDANEVGNYSKNAMAWAVETGLIKGSFINEELYLMPKASATRAQIATIFMRYIEG